MKTYTILLFILLLFLGCTQHPKPLVKELPNTYLTPAAFDELPQIERIDFDAVLEGFIYDCKSAKTQKLYGELCSKAEGVIDAKAFILNNFQAYLVHEKDGRSEGLLTGYYEPEIHASLHKDDVYKYPLYTPPNDLITVDLAPLYPELKHYRLRGRLEGNRLVPYYSREQIKRRDINSSVICYCRSQIDRFFLEVQGSGKVVLDDNSSFYVGYANQNGHKYSSIGKYLIKTGAIEAKNISLSSIRAYLEAYPEKVDEVLNQNRAMVFFSKRSQGATGALGLQLRPKSSVAVDRKYIPLGSMLYLSSYYDNNKKIDKFVYAQDVGGAIKGAVRADYFLGSGEEALRLAGSLKAPLRLWILLPKEKK